VARYKQKAWYLPEIISKRASEIKNDVKKLITKDGCGDNTCSLAVSSQDAVVPHKLPHEYHTSSRTLFSGKNGVNSY
jgi:hypothetical protein